MLEPSEVSDIANRPLRMVSRTVVEEVLQRGGRSVAEAFYHSRSRAAQQLGQDLMELSRLDWGSRCQDILRLLLQDLRERETSVKTDAPDDDRVELYEALSQTAIAAGSLEAIERQIEEAKKFGLSDEDKKAGKKPPPAVEISTCHRSKGDEWERVYVAGCNASKFPHKKATDIEEERRLFYVACTRAKKFLTLSVGGDHISPFLSDLHTGRVNDPIPPVTELQTDEEGGTWELDADGHRVYRKGKVAIIEMDGFTIRRTKERR